jgi:hypothetical protein
LSGQQAPAAQMQLGPYRVGSGGARGPAAPAGIRPALCFALSPQ